MCRDDCRLRSAAAFAGLGGFHLQGVVEAVEVVEEANGAEELDDFPIVVERAQLGELLIAEAVSIAGDGFGEADGGFFSWGEVFTDLPLGQVGKLVVAPAQVAREDRVRGQAVRRDVDLGSADDDQFLELALSTRVSALSSRRKTETTWPSLTRMRGA